MIEIVDGDDERLLIPFSLKVKGRKPLTFTLPRYDAIDPDTYVAMIDRIAEIEADEKSPAYLKRRQQPLAMLKLFVTDDQYALLEKLKLVQLDDIVRNWSNQSGVSLGELLASAPSSTESTVRPSSSTSSTTSESEDGTSGDA